MSERRDSHIPDPALFRLNGTPYSWTSCAHFFSGIPYKGITAVNYKETREVKLVHAAQQDGRPIGMTAGIYKVENVSFTMLRASAAALMADLSAFGLGSYGDAEIVYMLQHFEPPSLALPPSLPDLPLTVTLSGVRITGVEDKNEMGTDELVTELTCMAMFAIRSYGPVPLQLWSATRSLFP